MKQEDLHVEEVKKRLLEILSTYISRREQDQPLPEDANIREWGVDSIAAMELFAEIADEFGVRFGEEEIDFSILNSVDSITAFLVKKLSR